MTAAFKQSDRGVAPIPGESRWVVLHGLNWDKYDQLCRALDNVPIRTSYKKGTLEIMTLSPEHERSTHLWRRIVETLADLFDIEFGGLRSTTYRRKDLDQGLEPDECYYFKNWPKVARLKRLDLTRHPAPDLALEVDVTHSSLDRLSIYAELRVPEVWRFDGRRLTFLSLQDGKYVVVKKSLTFPGISAAELLPFYEIGLAGSERSMIRALREELPRKDH